MTPRLSITGRIAQSRILGKRWVRAAVFVPLIAILALLAFFPQRFEAMTTLTPSDSESLGLSGTLGQLGALNSVFGKQAAVEVALRVGTSVETRKQVIKKLDLRERLDEDDVIDIHRWLEDKVTVRSLRGGIILIEMMDRDPALAHDIVAAYAVAMRDRLAVVTKRQTAYKREVLEKLVNDASAQLADAEASYNSLRLEKGYADPETSLGEIASLVPSLRSSIRSKEIQIETASKLYTDENMTMVQLNTELAALRQRLAEAEQTNPATGQTVGEAIGVSAELYRRERDLNVAKGLYDSYLRYLQGTAVEDLTSDASIRILEDTYIDTKRQVWWPAAALSFALLLLWLAIEFYRLRPPVGARIVEQETARASDA